MCSFAREYLCSFCKKNIVTIHISLHFSLDRFSTIQINQLFERLIKHRTNFCVNILFLLKLKFKSLNIVRVSWKCYSLIIFESSNCFEIDRSLKVKFAIGNKQVIMLVSYRFDISNYNYYALKLAFIAFE